MTKQTASSSDAMQLFCVALGTLLQPTEGVVVERNGERYLILHTNDERITISTWDDGDDIDPDVPAKHGQMVWMHEPIVDGEVK